MSKTENFDSLFEAALAEAAPSQSYPKLDCEGTWTVKVLEGTYGKNQKGTANRTMVKVEVVANGEGSPDKVSARTNLYINEGTTQEYTDKNLAPWIKLLLSIGVTADKIKYEAVDYQDVIQNIATILTKQLKLGKDILLTLNLRSNGKDGFYKNVYQYDPEVKATEALGSVAGHDPFEADPF